ncbi:MAG: class III cytochrome c [Acidobacteria bacterium]|nr:MAG: class III cytochrome c [Acidobacteriota bacterium]
MLKKTLAYSAIAAFVITGSCLSCYAADPGPAEIILQGENTKKPKPASFPHKKHQDMGLGCGECHHGMDDSGKRIAYVDGQAIQKCGSCHNKEKLAGKKTGKLDLSTIKGAGHGKCLQCHKEKAKADHALKARKIDKCATCHPKKKK